MSTLLATSPSPDRREPTSDEYRRMLERVVASSYVGVRPMLEALNDARELLKRAERPQ